MSKTQVGTEASRKSGGDIYFQTYRELLRQRELIDRKIFRLQGKFFKAVSLSQQNVEKNIMKVKYVSRLRNVKTLANAIRESMVPREEMTMDDILQSLSKNGLYHTSSRYYYTMVNNKLHSDPYVKKVSRGVFIYHPRKKRQIVAIA